MSHSERIYEQMVKQNKKALELGMFCLSHGITKQDIFKLIDRNNDLALKKESEKD
jgi:hypothetical protein